MARAGFGVHTLLLVVGPLACFAPGKQLFAHEQAAQTFIAQFPDGAQIEVVGITEDKPPQTGSRRWWLPNGKELPTAARPNISLKPSAEVTPFAVGHDDLRWCLVVLKETNVRGTPGIEIGYDGLPWLQRYGAMVQPLETAPARPHSGFRVLRVGVFEHGTFGIRMRLETEAAWETIGESTIEPRQSRRGLIDCTRIIAIQPTTERLVKKQESQRLAGGRSSVSVKYVSTPLEKGETRISYVPPLVEARTNFRIVARNPDGKSFTPREEASYAYLYHEDREAPGESHGVVLYDFPFDHVAAVEVHAKPVHIIEFLGFAVEPGIGTNAELRSATWTLDDARQELMRLDRRERGTIGLYVCRPGSPVRCLRDASDELSLRDILKFGAIDLTDLRARGDDFQLYLWNGWSMSSGARAEPQARNPFIDTSYGTTLNPGAASLMTSGLDVRNKRWLSQRVTHLAHPRVPFKPKFVLLAGPAERWKDFASAVHDAAGDEFRDPAQLASLPENERTAAVDLTWLEINRDQLELIAGLFSRVVQAVASGDSVAFEQLPFAKSVMDKPGILSRLQFLRGAGLRTAERRSIAVYGDRALLVTHFQALRHGAGWIPDAGNAALYHFVTENGEWRLAAVTKADVDGVLLALCRLYSNVPTTDNSASE